MTGKERALEVLETLPDDVSWEEVLDALSLDEALEKAIDAVNRDEVVSHEEIIRRFAVKSFALRRSRN